MDWFALAETSAVAASAIVTAGMAVYTRRLAARTADMASAARAESMAVVDQGQAIAAQAAAAIAQVRTVEVQAELAREQVELTREALRSSVRPWLVLGEDEPSEGVQVIAGARMSGAVPRFWLTETASEVSVSLTVRNIGSGLALLDPRRSFVVSRPDPRSSDEALRQFNSGRVATPVLPPGAQTRIEFEVTASRWATDVRSLTNRHSGDGEIWFDVTCTDIGGTGDQRVRFHAVRTAATDRWEIFECQYFSADSEEPVVTVRTH